MGERVVDRVRARVEDLQVFRSPAARRRFLLHAAVVLVALVGTALLVRQHLPVLTDAAELRRVVRRFGPLGPLVLVGLQAAQVVVAPVPGQVLAIVAGYLYGAWLGTLYNMIGITIGSTAAFWLARRYGRGYVERVVHPPTLARFDDIDDDHAGLGLFVCFLVPGLPDDVICFAGGLTTIPLWQLVAIAVVGRTPGFFLINVVGEFVEAGRLDAAVLVAALVTVVSAVCYLQRDRIVRFVGGDP